MQGYEENTEADDRLDVFGQTGKKRPVDLPHTWNATDGQDGGNDYYRGTCTYEKTVAKPQFTADERVYLQFHGVNASAKVLLNGKELCTHDNGYSTFRVDVTDELLEENRFGWRLTTVSTTEGVSAEGRFYVLRRNLPRCRVF